MEEEVMEQSEFHEQATDKQNCCNDNASLDFEKDSIVETVQDDYKSQNELVERFANVSELQKAYKHLRAEFTRKCQRLSDLEKLTGLNTSVVSEEQNRGLEDANLIVETKEDIEADNVKEYIVQGKSVQTPKVDEQKNAIESDRVQGREEIIREYLLSVSKNSSAPAVISNGGVGFVGSSGKQVATLNSATRQVEDFFRNKR